jgi:hypothetical protein
MGVGARFALRSGTPDPTTLTGTSLSSLKQPHRHLDYPNHLDQFRAHLPSIKFIILLSYFNVKHLQIPQQRAGNHLVMIDSREPNKPIYLFDFQDIELRKLIDAERSQIRSS